MLLLLDYKNYEGKLVVFDMDSHNLIGSNWLKTLFVNVLTEGELENFQYSGAITESLQYGISMSNIYNISQPMSVNLYF